MSDASFFISLTLLPWSCNYTVSDAYTLSRALLAFPCPSSWHIPPSAYPLHLSISSDYDTKGENPTYIDRWAVADCPLSRSMPLGTPNLERRIPREAALSASRLAVRTEVVLGLGLGVLGTTTTNTPNMAGPRSQHEMFGEEPDIPTEFDVSPCKHSCYSYTHKDPNRSHTAANEGERLFLL
nr:hypothetical protein L203_03181 [Cryptococcus depauperatus CBS 7841]